MKFFLITALFLGGASTQICKEEDQLYFLEVSFLSVRMQKAAFHLEFCLVLEVIKVRLALLFVCALSDYMVVSWWC